MRNFFFPFNQLHIFISLLFASSLLLLINQGCNRTGASKETGTDPGFSAFISGYTGGILSTGSPVRIRLSQSVDDTIISRTAERPDLLRIKPEIDGDVLWVDNQTIEFRPRNRFLQDQAYRVSFKLGKLMDLPDEYATFSFTFHTMPQNFEVRIEGVQTASLQDLSTQVIQGTLLTADVAEDEQVEKVLKALQEGKDLEITWDHGSDGRSHRFEVNNVKRSNQSSAVQLSWNGQPVSVTAEGSHQVKIPSLDDFRLMEARVVQYPEQHILLSFSDPIKQDQQMKGLITLDNQTSLNLAINKNEVRVYPVVKQSGTHSVLIHKGIQNILGYKLPGEETIELEFDQVRPAVRSVASGVILPTSKKLILPFDAVNLKAVEVQIIRIFEDNISQFLQVNNLKGRNEMKRVGYPVVHKVVPLLSSGAVDLSHWDRYNLDLSELINAEPGAIYQVRLRFSKKHSVYYCGEDIERTVMDELVSDNESWDSYETSYWDSFDYYYPPGYQWDERDNPCHVSYYNSDRFISHNLLVSDLGMIAKIGATDNMQVFVNDIKSTGPVPGVTLELYDFQQQLMEKIMTDDRGQARFSLSKKPFLIIARKEGQRGYLKLNDGQALSLSNFDVGGQPVKTGIKGFIYGERGVWRPGDSLHIAFVLEDKNNIIPEEHPVIFELNNPLGQQTHRMIRNESLGDIYKFSLKTAEDAPTGNWQGEVIVGGAVFNHSFKIESIKPNRLKINLEFGNDRLTVDDSYASGLLRVRWLHGAVARNLKAEFDVSLAASETTFDAYPEYVFDDPVRRFEMEDQRIFDGYLDEKGEARVNARLAVEEAAPGMLMAYFRGKVYEEGGNFSVDRFSVPYYPYNSFVGIRVPEGDASRGMLLTDTTHIIRMVTVDPDGGLIERSGLQMEVYKLDWRWWWDSSEEYLGNYVSSSYYQPVLKTEVITRNGKGLADFKIEYPDWGRYLIRVCDPVSGHCTGKIVYVDWPGWAGRAKKDIPGGAAMLMLAADKESYETGENIELTIPGSAVGRALISIENGSKILETHWLNTREGENAFSFRAKEGYAPNIYVHVALLQPHAQTINDLPIRMYGILNIGIDDPETHITPVINMPEELEPEETFTIQVNEKDGKEMAYTIAVVDDGLLDLTRFKTPDPWNTFYAKESLGVNTWDVYDEVIGAYGGTLERLLSVGGDAAIERPEGSRASRFEPVVLFKGPFLLKKGKTNKHTFKMPRYIGSVRTMVVAAGNGAYGSQQQTIPVRKNLMVLGTLPRVLGPSEKLNLPVNVFSYDESANKVNVTVKTNDMITITGPGSKEINFDQTGDQMVYFPVEVKPSLGLARFEIRAQAGAMIAVHTIEVDVRNPNTPVVQVYDATLQPGETWDGNFGLPGMAGTNNAILEISTLPPLDLGKRLRYLLNYPHGCLEQTVSAAFPQLFLHEIMDVDKRIREMTENHIKEAIRKINDFQNYDGGFRYWPNQSSTDDWATSYAGHFLLEAKNKGYDVNDTVLKRWIRYQKQSANRWRKTGKYHRDDLMQAYRLYTLALANEAAVGAMNRLRQESMTLQASWRLAAAYVLAGQEEAAEDLVHSLEKEVSEYKEQSNSYGSHIRDEAMILETLGLMNKKTEGGSLLKNIAGYLSNTGQWMSTQTTAYCLIGISKFISKENFSDKIRFSYQLNGKEYTAETGYPVIQKELPVTSGEKVILSITNQGDGLLFSRVIVNGTPLVDPAEKIENNLRIKMVYKDMNGNPVNTQQLRQGTDLMADLVITNPGLRGHYRELALTEIFPSGFEIINTRMDELSSLQYKKQPDYQDVRDDRVLSYFDLEAGKSINIRILLNATYSGYYYLPPVSCAAMYDQSVSARLPGQWIEIIPVD